MAVALSSSLKAMYLKPRKIMSILQAKACPCFDAWVDGQRLFPSTLSCHDQSYDSIRQKHQPTIILAA